MLGLSHSSLHMQHMDESSEGRSTVPARFTFESRCIRTVEQLYVLALKMALDADRFRFRHSMARHA